MICKANRRLKLANRYFYQNSGYFTDIIFLLPYNFPFWDPQTVLNQFVPVYCDAPYSFRKGYIELLLINIPFLHHTTERQLDIFFRYVIEVGYRIHCTEEGRYNGRFILHIIEIADNHLIVTSQYIISHRKLNGSGGHCLQLLAERVFNAVYDNCFM